MSLGNARCLSRAPSQTENYRRTERNVAVNLGQVASRSDQQGGEVILEATEGLCCSWRWTL